MNSTRFIQNARFHRPIIQVLIVFMLLVSGCVEDPPVDPPVTSATLTLSFDHFVNSEEISYFTLDHTNEAGNLYSVYALKYLISNISLIRSDDSRIEFEDVYGFINAEDERTTLSLPDIDFDTYKGIEFQIGLDEGINGADPGLLPLDHPLNPILNGMHWSWTQGYRFIVIEGQYEDVDTNIGAYSFHIGDDSNKFTLDFDMGSFDFNKDMTASFHFELNELFKNPNVHDLNVNGDFTHSGNDGGTAASLVENLVNAWSFDSVN